MSRETISSQDSPQIISFNFLAKKASTTVMGHTLILLICLVICGSAVQLEDIDDTKPSKLQYVPNVTTESKVETYFFLVLEMENYFMSQAPQPPPLFQHQQSVGYRPQQPW